MQTPESSLRHLTKLRATIPKVYIPTTGPDDWQRFLADPAKQWGTGFSAKTLAYCWEISHNLLLCSTRQRRPPWSTDSLLLGQTRDLPYT
jgi:hypothetical protein